MVAHPSPEPGDSRYPEEHLADVPSPTDTDFHWEAFSDARGQKRVRRVGDFCPQSTFAMQMALSAAQPRGSCHSSRTSEPLHHISSLSTLSPSLQPPRLQVKRHFQVWLFCRACRAHQNLREKLLWLIFRWQHVNILESEVWWKIHDSSFDFPPSCRKDSFLVSRWHFFLDSIVEFGEWWCIVYQQRFLFSYFSCLVYSKRKSASERQSSPKQRSQIVTYHTKAVLMLVFQF